MKTVSGRIESSKPISLSKAAKVLSTFVAAETGASQAVSAYLRRTSAAFNELTQLHKDIRGSRKQKKHLSYKTTCAAEKEGVEDPGQHDAVSVVERGGDGESGSLGKKEKKKKKKVEGGQSGDFGENRGEVENQEREGEGNLGFGVEKRKKRKKSQVAEVEYDGSEQQSNSKKKKRRKSKGDD